MKAPVALLNPQRFIWGQSRSLIQSCRLKTKATSFIQSHIAYDSIQGNRVMMGVSTRIVLVPIPASQKLSANCLANYAAAVHPDMRRKQRRSIVPKFLLAILRI
ncbi:hypothetical protein E5S67_01506 [Microcoleus sp. IPMA8]|uniref:Uncharacterized protein n=1 Tax=Microcoleus asticus IPMA8 TaxID=2563858 RepID=A0ABX2CWI6_9CYAN|nr:hypothetical protein [Microcoleus asticus IPMA8]